MADRGHELTDEILNSLENRIADEYAVATRDMQRKFREYMEKFEAEDEKQKALLKAGKITKKEYSDWRYRHMMVGKRWEAMKDVLAQDLEHASDIALKIAGEKMADVYALNANFATYQIEHDAKIDTGFTLYNHDTAEYLLKEQRQLMPVPSAKKAAEIAADKALQWDIQRIQSAVLQGVLQGESPFDIAKRLRGVAQMDYNASVRYARTMTTSAQNAGRYEAFHRAKKLGVDLTIEWQATLDGRTRHDHRLMHGQRREVDEPFKLPSGQEILYPADSRGGSYELQGEIWNCRCTLLSWVKGFEGDTVKDSPKMGDMSFEEWQQEKAPKEKAPKEEFVAAGTVEQANTSGKRIFEQAYENHRIENGTRSVPAAELKDTGVISANYGKMSVESANAFNSALAGLTRDFDTPLSTIRTMTKNEFLGNGDSFAFVTHDYTADSATMVINPSKCKDLTKLTDRIKELSENGYCAKIKPELADQYVVTHEFAHSVLNMPDKLSDKTNWVGADYKKIRAARKEIGEIYDRYAEDVGGLMKKAKELELQTILATDIQEAERLQGLFMKADAELGTKKISEYSLANSDEFLAEAFTNERIGTTSNPYGAEVMKVFLKYFGRK